MKAKHKNGVVSARSAKKVARKGRSTLARLGRMPGRTIRFVKSNPVRVTVGVAALALVAAKLKNLI